MRTGAWEPAKTRAITQELQQLAAEPDLEDYLKVLLAKLQAILQGERAPALADDPALNFDDTVELRLLLEAFSQ
ncbi:MAG: hypothetical protein GY862_27625 [Gammaproteobacteria bacterium]|nr:hypothetical protein [Gammaproteobacteria bacterium]